MKSENTAKQISRLVALSALFLIPLAPLLVASGYFFPFITGKAFFFRILVEVLVGAWAVLAFFDAEYRPRFSYIGIAVLGFVGWMFVADSLAINAAKAFWSNAERMEGWILLIHLLGFFFASSAVLRVEKKWRTWFLTSLGVSIFVSLYALVQLGGGAPIHQGSTRIDASFGNSAYLAIYLLFNVFFASWLALTEKHAWLKWGLIALATVEGILIFFTETRGTILGLVGALALAALLTVCTAGKHARRFAAGALVGIVLFSGGFYATRHSAFVQHNHVLQRVASISLADGQTRFTIWHIAFQGVAEKPIFGWGQEGFNYVFNKFYDPSLYGQEPWFDRAHNAFLDWLVAGGVPAFLFYLALFGTAFVALWRNSVLSRPERIALTGALLGYACHNLFVFDNLYSYIYFFVTLALIDSQVGRPIEWLERLPVVSAEDGVTYVLPIASVLVLVSVWTINISGMNTVSELITAMTPSSDDLSSNLEYFKDLTARPSFATQEIREQLIDFSVSAVQNSSTTTPAERDLVSLAVLEMQKQVAKYPLDAREHLELSYAYRAAGDASNAFKELQIAQTLSPKKEAIFIEKGILEWQAGDISGMQSDFRAAYALRPQSSALAVYAAVAEIEGGNATASKKILQDAFGTTTVDSDVLASAYYGVKDWPDLIAIWQLRASKPGASVRTWFGLAAAYYAAGDFTRAIQTINAAVAQYPDAASAGADAIAQIKQKAGRR